MFKITNTLLLIIVLFTACSSQESNETNETNSTKVQKSVTAVTTEKKETTTAETNSSTMKTPETKVKDQNTTTEKTSLFTLTTLEGKTIHIDEAEGGLAFKEYKDKAVIVLFFGHRCPPCLREIPVLKALVDKGHKDLEIIAIEVQGYTEEQLKAFKESKGINYTLVANTANSNFINYIGKQTQWSGAIPFLIGFDKKAVVKIVHAGGLGEKDFDNIYETLTKGE
jgi:thiol-disulfide isomerase/thioredoxin